METVAAFLEAEARQRARSDYDLFARSAFNRYYYACYRIVWTLHKTIYPATRVPGHSNLPERIEGDLYDRYRKQVWAAERNNLLSADDGERLRANVRRLTSDLSNLLREGYAVRCVADYDLDVLVVLNGANFTLESTSLATASGWIRRVNLLCGSLISEWRRLGN